MMVQEEEEDLNHSNNDDHEPKIIPKKEEVVAVAAALPKEEKVIEKVTEKMSNLHANDHMLPPEDDSVQDEDADDLLEGDAAPAVVDLDEEDNDEDL